jgi:tetratricopeptide (TPR) repeat protein
MTPLGVKDAQAKKGSRAKIKKKSGDQDQAKKAYLDAQRLFKAEEYELALPLFEEAYRLSNGKPTSILALAQCLRMNKLYARSIARFTEYLQTDEGKKNAIRVSETLKILEQQFAKIQALEAQHEKERKASEAQRERETEELAKKVAEQIVIPVMPSPPGMAKEEDSLTSKPWFWVTLGLVIAGAGTGGIVVGLNAQTSDEYRGTTGLLLTP